jgi:hypothetical protein
MVRKRRLRPYTEPKEGYLPGVAKRLVEEGLALPLLYGAEGAGRNPRAYRKNESIKGIGQMGKARVLSFDEIKAEQRGVRRGNLRLKSRERRRANAF